MDATTSVENPLACVITSISFDHMQYLGNTVSRAIAGEKAGIIVPGVPVIYDGNDERAAGVIADPCRGTGKSVITRLPEEKQKLSEPQFPALIFLSGMGIMMILLFHIPFIA